MMDSPETARAHPGVTSLLALRNVRIVYGGAITAVHDLSLKVDEASIVALLGTNGAGKSTTLKAVCGLLAAEGGKVAGEVALAGRSLLGLRPDQIVGCGVALVPEGRQLFASLTVRQNLSMGAYLQRAQALDPVLALFPALADKLERVAGYLSGGEQQMVAIGRALMARPRVLLLDEPSLGLAPLIVREIFSALRRLRDEQGMTILLIEQNARLALELADRAYVLENGHLVLEGSSAQLSADVMIRDLYLGRGARGSEAAQAVKSAWRTRTRWPA